MNNIFIASLLPIHELVCNGIIIDGNDKLHAMHLQQV